MLLCTYKGAFYMFRSLFNISLKHSLIEHSISSVVERKMTTCAYERAIIALNGLQSNAAYLQKARAERSTKAHQNLTNTKRYLETLRIKPDEIDSLNVIHVAGTKGKGSTCAFTENILRNHGYKTGFYSSPHLIYVNERIRVNGNPLPKDKFAAYFWDVYDAIKRSLEEDENMPSYFLFLTVMAFYVFIKERVDAAIIEVGIGGLYDCTNIIRKPVAVGITTLGIDHVNLLGSTITEIAAQKAGIMKSGVPTFTVSQPENALLVLRKKAQSVGCSLSLSPPLESYENKISLGIQGIVQNVNASLALQLSHCWLSTSKLIDNNSLNILTNTHDTENVTNDKDHFNPILMADTFPLNSETQRALENCIWPGRFHIVKKGKFTFYLDGAHTQQSMKYCSRWFEEQSSIEQKNLKSSTLKVLLFNCTGERNADCLLDPLADLQFDLVMFSPNKVAIIKDTASDLSNFMVNPDQEMQQCITNKEIWCHLMSSLYENEQSMSSNSLNISGFSHEKTSSDYNSVIFPTISDALNWVYLSDTEKSNQNEKLLEMLKEANHIQILVTGSLHLVGGVLSLIQS